MSGAQRPTPATFDHLADCDGNGFVDCWKCGGDGEYDAPIDDCTDELATCDECNGAGGFVCPACSENSRDETSN